MKKTLKNVLLTVLLAVFAMSMVLFVACNKTPKTVNYSVTVQLDDNSPAEGVKVQIKKGSAAFESKNTDANGKAEFELASDEYDVALSNLPELYSVPESASLKLTAKNPDLTVKLEKAFTYTVKLVNPDKTPFYAEGVTVGVCTLDGNCLEAVDLKTDGTVVIAAEAGNYHVKVYDLPDYCAYEWDDDKYYTGEDFSATKTEMTITIYSVNTFVNVDGTEMSAAEKAASSLNEAEQQRTAYKLSLDVEAGKTEYFGVKGAVAGKYGVHTNAFTIEGLTVLPVGQTFSVVWHEQYMGASYTANVNADGYYFFMATNSGEAKATLEVIATVPFSSYLEYEGQGGDVTLTVGKAETQAVLAFKPTKGGEYKFTVKGETLAVLTLAEYAPNDEFLTSTPADSEYKTGATATLFAYTSQAGKSVYVLITAKADKYPVEVALEIRRTSDAQDTKEVVEVIEPLTQYAEQEGSLIGVPLDGTAEQLVYSHADNFYHYGSAAGPVVVVKITTSLEQSRFAAGGALAYFEMVYPTLADYVFTTVNEAGNGEDTLDYRFFIRGFDEYDYEPNMSGGNTALIPAITYAKPYYAKFVNSDGVYPLTIELEEFLKKFYEANSYSCMTNLPWDTDFEDAWMFPCFYYGEEDDDNTEADAIVGEYEFVRNVQFGDELTVGEEARVWDQSLNDGTGGMTNKLVEANWYKLVVNKNKTFTVLKLLDDDYDPEMSGAWSKSGDVYTFTVRGLGGEEVYAVTFNAESGNIVLKLDGDDELSVWEFNKVVEVDPIVGEYKFVKKIEYGDETKVGDVVDVWDDEANGGEGGYVPGGNVEDTWYKLVVESDGTFTVYRLVDGNYEPETQVCGTWSKDGDNYKLTVPAFFDWMPGDEYTVTFNAEDGTVKIIIEESVDEWEFQK